MPKHSITGVIIADRRSLQTDGAVFAGEGRPAASQALSRLAAHFDALFAEVIFVAADPLALLDRDGLIVSDHFAPAGLLSGIHAGLFAARHSHVLVTAPDLPMMTPAVIDLLLEAVSRQVDAVLAVAADDVQPLPAVYAKTCLKTLSRQLAHGRPAVRRWLRQIRIMTVSQSLLRKCDPQWKPPFRLTADAPE